MDSGNNQVYTICGTFIDSILDRTVNRLRGDFIDAVGSQVFGGVGKKKLRFIGLLFGANQFCFKLVRMSIARKILDRPR